MIPAVSASRPRWLTNWLQRHRDRRSRWLHYVGIPLTIAAVILALVQLWQWRWDLWWRPAILLVAGYGLQLIGHRLEGNDMGEVIIVKRLLGKPYQATSPRHTRPTAKAGPRTD
jgi:hypothetical protein